MRTPSPLSGRRRTPPSPARRGAPRRRGPGCVRRRRGRAASPASYEVAGGSAGGAVSAGGRATGATSAAGALDVPKSTLTGSRSAGVSISKKSRLVKPPKPAITEFGNVWILVLYDWTLPL